VILGTGLICTFPCNFPCSSPAPHQAGLLGLQQAQELVAGLELVQRLGRQALHGAQGVEGVQGRLARGGRYRPHTGLVLQDSWVCGG
jgi:hypothetical protein